MNSRVAARQFFGPYKGVVPRDLLDRAMDKVFADLMGARVEAQKSIFPETVLKGLRQSALSTKGIEKKDWWAIRNGVIAVYEDLCTFDKLLAGVLPSALKGDIGTVSDINLEANFVKAHQILVRNLLSKQANPAAYVRVKALGMQVKRVLTRLEATAKSTYARVAKDFSKFNNQVITDTQPIIAYFKSIGQTYSDADIRRALIADDKDPRLGKLSEKFLFEAFSNATKDFAKNDQFSTLRKQIRAIVDPSSGLFVEYITITLDSIETFKRREFRVSNRVRKARIAESLKLSKSLYTVDLTHETLKEMSKEEAEVYCATKPLSEIASMIKPLPGVDLNDPTTLYFKEREQATAGLEDSVQRTMVFGVVQRKKKGPFFGYGVWRKARQRELDLKGSSDDIKTAILENDYITEVAEEFIVNKAVGAGWEADTSSSGKPKYESMFLPDGSFRKVFTIFKRAKPGDPESKIVEKKYIAINKEDMAEIKTPLEFTSLADAKAHFEQIHPENQLLLKNPYVVQDLANRDLPQITPDLESQLFGDVVYKSLYDNASANSITRVYPTRKIEIDGFEYHVVTEGRFKNHILEFLVNAAGKQIEGSRLEYSAAFNAVIGQDQFGKFAKGQRKGTRQQDSRQIDLEVEVDGRKVKIKGTAPTLDLEPFMSTYEGGEGDTKLFLTLPTAQRNDGLQSPYVDEGMRQGVADFVDQFCSESINISKTARGLQHNATYLVDPADYAKLRDFLGSCAMTTDASRTVEGYYQNLRRFVAATSEDNLSFYTEDALVDLGGNKYFKPGVKLNNMQRKAIAWMEENGFKGVMGLGTGVGKTLLSAVSAYMILEQKFKEGGDTSNGRVLYVQPRALVGNLTGELEVLTNIPSAIGNIGKDTLSLQIADASKSSLDALRSDTPRRAFDEVAYETFDAMSQDDIDRYSAILFDEAQNLNPVSPLATSRARKASRARTENKILLTASTMEESPQDLFKLVSITNSQDLFPDAKIAKKAPDGILYADLHDFASDSASDKRRKDELRRILSENGVKLSEVTYKGKVSFALSSSSTGHLGAIRDLIDGGVRLKPAFVNSVTTNGRVINGKIAEAVKAVGKNNAGAVARELGISEEDYAGYIKKNSPLIAMYEGKRLVNPVTGRNLKVAENFQENYATRIGSRWVGLNPDPIKKNEFLTWVSTNAFFANKLDVDFEEINKPALASIDQETVTLAMPKEFEEVYKKTAKKIAVSLNNLALYFKDGRVDQEGLAKLKPSERKELFSQVNKVSREMKILNLMNLRPHEAIRLGRFSTEDANKIRKSIASVVGNESIDVGIKSVQAAQLATQRMQEGAGLSRTIFFADDPHTVRNHAQYMSKQKGMTDAYHVSATDKEISVYKAGKMVKTFPKPKTNAGAKKIESTINEFKVSSLGFSATDGGAPKPPKPSSFKAYRTKAKSATAKGAYSLISSVFENANKVKKAWAKVSSADSPYYEASQALDHQVVEGLLNLNREDYASMSEANLSDASFREGAVIDALSQRDKNLYNQGVIEKILNPPIPQVGLEDKEDSELILKARALDLDKTLSAVLDPENPKALKKDKRARKRIIADIKKEEKARKGINAGNWAKKIIESLFVKDPSCGVVTITLTGKEGKKGGSGGYSKGFNLQTFDTVIHLDRDSWSSEEMEQRRGRAWRTGQPDRVQEYTVDLVFSNEKEYVDASEQNKKVDKLSDEELIAFANTLISESKKAKEGGIPEIEGVIPNLGDMPKAVRDAGGDDQKRKDAYALRSNLEVAIKTYLAEKMEALSTAGSGGASNLMASVDSIRKFLEQSDSDLFAQVIKGSTALTEEGDDGEAPLGSEFFKSEEKVGGKGLALQHQAFVGSLAPISSGLKENDERQKRINSDPIRSIDASQDLGRFNEATLNVGGKSMSATALMDESSDINQELSAQFDGLPTTPKASDLIDLAGFSGLRGLKGAMDVNVNLQVDNSTIEAVRNNVKLPEGATLIENGMASVSTKGFNSPFGSMERVFYRYQDAEGNVKMGLYNASLRFQDNDCIPEGALDRLVVSQMSVAEKFGISKIDSDPNTEAKAALCAYGFSSQISKGTISKWKQSFRNVQAKRAEIIDKSYAKLAGDADLLRQTYEAVMYCIISGREAQLGRESFGSFRKAVYKKKGKQVEGVMFALKSEIDASLEASNPPTDVRTLVDFFLNQISDLDSAYSYDPKDFTDEQVVDEYNAVFQAKGTNRRGVLGKKVTGVPKLKMVGKKGQPKTLAWSNAENAYAIYGALTRSEDDPVGGLDAFLNKEGESKGVLKVLSPEDISYQTVREAVAVYCTLHNAVVGPVKKLMRGKRTYFDAYVELIRTPLKGSDGKMAKHEIELSDLSLDLTDSEDNLSRKAIEAKMVASLRDHRGDPNRWLNSDLADFANTKDCQDKARAGQFPWVKTASLTIEDYIADLGMQEPDPADALLNLNDFVSKLNNKGDSFTISDSEEEQMNTIFNDLAAQKNNEEVLDGVVALLQYKSFQ